MRPNGRGVPAAERIRRRTAQAVALASARGPEGMRRRLDRLEGEWSVENASQLLWGLAALAGLAAGARDRRWLGLTGVSSASLLQSAFLGRCPAFPALRLLGFRTLREIAQEREALIGAL